MSGCHCHSTVPLPRALPDGGDRCSLVHAISVQDYLGLSCHGSRIAPCYEIFRVP
jgi:hypothetical protein